MKTPNVSKVVTAHGEVNFSAMSQSQIEAHLKKYPHHNQYFTVTPEAKEPEKAPKEEPKK